MSRVERVARIAGLVFAVELLLVLVLGAMAAWRLEDPALRGAAPVAAVAWVVLLIAMLAPPRSIRASWSGPLQLVAAWMVFPMFKAIAQVFVTSPADAALLALDRRLLGGTSAPEYVLGWEQPWLSEILSAGYFSFYLMIIVPALYYGWRRRSAQARAFFFGLMLMYLAGFAGYLLVPAAGPFLAFPDAFPYPPQGGPMTAFLVAVVSEGITGMDVFPSLHTGIALYVLGFFAQAGHRRLAWLLVPWVAALLLATVYLRYHYGIDLVAGVVLAAAVLAITGRYREAVSP